MQKKFSPVLLLLALGLSLSLGACNRDKNQVNEIRNFSQFTEVEVSVSGDVFIRTDSTRDHSVNIIGPKWQVENLKFRQEGTRLIIESRGATNKVDLNIDLPRVTRITCSGGGRVRGGMASVSGIGSYALNSDGPLTIRSTGSGDVIFETNTNNLDVSCTGSGSADVYNNSAIDANLTARVTGSGRMRVDGKGDIVTTTVTGSGEGDFERFQGKRAFNTATGSGATRLHASETADITISGSGSVYVSGGAKVTSKVTGSGRVIMK